MLVRRAIGSNYFVQYYEMFCKYHFVRCIVCAFSKARTNESPSVTPSVVLPRLVLGAVMAVVKLYRVV